MDAHGKAVAEDAFRGAWAIWRMSDTEELNAAVSEDSLRKLESIGLLMSGLIGDIKRGHFWKVQQ